MSALANRNNLIGIASLCAGAFVFSTQDAIIKLVSGDHALTLAIALRGMVSFPVLVAMVWWDGGLRLLNTPQWKRLCLRGLILLSAYTTYFMAFPALPLAEAIALFFMTPLLVTIMAIPLLGEHVSLKALGAVVLGLVGVFVILKPGSGLFNPAALLSLVSAAAYGFAMIMARRHGTDTPASVMSFYTNVVYILGALAIAVVVEVFRISPTGHPSVDFLTRAWHMPAVRDLLLMGTCGVIAAFGMVLLTHAYRVGAANIVTPFEYTGMIWATTWGFLLFGEVPKFTTLLGMGLIAVAGVLALNAGAKAAQVPVEA